MNGGGLLLSSVAKHKCCLVGSSLLIFLCRISAPLSLSSNTSAPAGRVCITQGPPFPTRSPPLLSTRTSLASSLPMNLFLFERFRWHLNSSHRFPYGGGVSSQFFKRAEIDHLNIWPGGHRDHTRTMWDRHKRKGKWPGIADWKKLDAAGEQKQNIRGETLHLKGHPQEGAAGQSIPNAPELHIKTFSTQEILFVYENSLVNSPHCQQSCALILNLQCRMLI